MKQNITLIICLLCFGQVLMAQDIYYFKSSNGRYGFQDNNGKVVIQPKYDWVGDVSKEGLIKVNIGCDECGNYEWNVKGGKWGFINARGKEIVSVKYDRADNFREGFSRVRLGKKWGFVNLEGKEAIPLIPAAGRCHHRPEPQGKRNPIAI